jgi:hypothetical protein
MVRSPLRVHTWRSIVLQSRFLKTSHFPSPFYVSNDEWRLNMKICQTSDRATFMANRPPGVAVRVVRKASTSIERRGDYLVSLPAIVLVYSFVRGDQEWVFQEQRIGLENGALIDLRDTLWGELEQTGEYRLLRCSGSF